MLVRSLEQAGPAAIAGLQTFDIVVALDDKPVTGVDDLLRRLTADQLGRAIKVTALRRTDLREFYLLPQERR